MDNSRNETSIKPFVFLALFVLAVWAISLHIIHVNFDLTESGQLGDSSGLINSLFSGFAFAGIIYTILLQRKELKLQREELEETRKELARAASAQEKSERALTKQIDAMSNTAILQGYNSLMDLAIFQSDSNKLFHQSNLKKAQELGDKIRKKIEHIDSST